MIITPYMNRSDENMAQAYMNTHKQPVFVMAVELDERYVDYCRNCAGIGFLHIRYMRAGPFKDAPMTKDVITWFDGNARFGRGWYIQGNTLTLVCPHCGGGQIDPKRLIQLGKETEPQNEPE